MAIKYITMTWPDADSRQETGRTKMLARFAAFFGTRPARFKMVGGDWGDYLKRPMRHLRDRTQSMDVGPRLVAQRKDGKALLVQKERVAEVPDLGAYPMIEKVLGRVIEKFGPVGDLGTFVCRYVDGTHTVSRHGYLGDTWKGAAHDIGASTMARLESIADYIVTLHRLGEVSVAVVIVNQRIWLASTNRWEYYSGDRHYHVHYDVNEGHACSP